MADYFIKLKNLLNELFQLDQPELDFGFYRIMHAKAEQVSKFIENDLLKTIHGSFGEVNEAKMVQLQAEYEESIKKAREYGVPVPEETEPVKKARAALDELKNNSLAEKEVYEHLYRFFERYYDNGDFLSKRYLVRETPGKAAPFAIPYNGEEVKLHWANADQYYIKTTEYFSSYTVNLKDSQTSDSAGINGRVHFRIVDASEGEHGNIKASDSTKRFFIINSAKPIEITENGELNINFVYRPDSEKTGQDNQWREKRNSEAVDVIIRELDNMKKESSAASEYLRLLLKPAPTEKDKKRTVLARYINQYTARNTMDYFIHKDLGGFLKRELDFYIKNEIMHLDDIENADTPTVDSYLSKIKVMRKIAGKIIDFLAQLENFQKKLWLKKKFVVETNYCMTLDRVPEELYEEIAQNKEQWEEWKNLGFIDVEQRNNDRIADIPPADSNRIAGVPPADNNQKAGVPPSDNNRIAGVPPANSNRIAGVPPANSNRIAGVPPADSNRIAGVPPADSNRKAGVPPAVSQFKPIEQGLLNFSETTEISGSFQHKGWYSRGSLPHFDNPGLVQFVTFRLNDSVPAEQIEKWKLELQWEEIENADSSKTAALREKIEEYSDTGKGECFLKNERIAEIVQNALIHYDEEKYRLLAWCIMPNHVHVLIETFEGHKLPDVIQGWKSFTSHQANKILDRIGKFWKDDYFDRFIRNDAHFSETIEYIHLNPVKAGLVEKPNDWRWSSVVFDIEGKIAKMVSGVKATKDGTSITQTVDALPADNDWKAGVSTADNDRIAGVPPADNNRIAGVPPAENNPSSNSSEVQPQIISRLNNSFDRLSIRRGRDAHDPREAGPCGRDARDPGGVDFLRHNPYLVIDTKFFGQDFKDRLLSGIEELDAQCNGLLIHSENFQALNLLQERYREQVKCVYIDPPYNKRKDDDFQYKDSLQHSSWISLIYDRLILAKRVLTENSFLFHSIDENEFNHLYFVGQNLAGFSGVKSLPAITNLKGNQDTEGFASCHEYVIVFANKAFSDMGRLPIDEELLMEGWQEDEYGIYKKADGLRATGANSPRIKRPKLWYPIFFLPDGSDFYATEENLAKCENHIAVWPVNEDGDELSWYWKKNKVNAEKYNLIVSKARDGSFTLYKKQRPGIGDVPTKKPKSFFYAPEYSSTHGGNLAQDMFNQRMSSFTPKSVRFIQDIVLLGLADKVGIVLDYFAGSGTTAHAVINLNREDGGKRKYILVEMGDYFNTVLKPRIQKVIYSKDWKDGKPVPAGSAGVTPAQTDQGVICRYDGVSHIFKYIRLESYEDALNNLRFEENPLRKKGLDSNPSLREDYILRYMMDMETRGSSSLVNIESFACPDSYRMKVKKPGSDEYAEQNIDLIETFNYLIGLRIIHISEPQSFRASFRRETDPELPEDQQTKLIAEDGINRDSEGSWRFRKIEGFVPKSSHDPNNGEIDKVLIIWRNLTGDPEKDNLMLDEWFKKNRIDTKDFEFDIIYVNGSNNLPNLRQEKENWKVRLIEEEFMKRMWETDGF